MRADDDTTHDAAVFTSQVLPFFKSHCVKCHGREKSKGEITLHGLGDLSSGHDVEKWELILEMLESGEMPPEDEPQLDKTERKAIVEWIEAELREFVSKSKRVEVAPTARRLTNFEYENTIRDLLGIELKLIQYLPKDPVKSYKFNNTAELMRMGPEQIDRNLECARRAMASAIVDPVKPEVHKTWREWNPHGLDKGPGGDEFGVWGNRRNTPASGQRRWT